KKQALQDGVSATSVVVNAAVATAAADDSHPIDSPQVPTETEERINRETGEMLFPGDEDYEELAGKTDDLT
ncbi:hypothetical protein ABCU18_004467, partial [Shigella flexneri]